MGGDLWAMETLLEWVLELSAGWAGMEESQMEGSGVCPVVGRGGGTITGLSYFRMAGVG